MKNYTLTQSRYVRDLNCEVTIYRHNKTGATMIVMPADDDNRAISIAFSTPAEDNKGIPHIIEHSVLCGSEKFPLKDPFVQLMKGSMYSFLNAMTYSDFTVYPVASTNEKDFKNLAGVYLDAAFDPLVTHKKEIFLQEGIHYALDEDETAVKEYNGVVFNEMKGVEGSPDALMANAIVASLFKETPYVYDSGGVPTAICDLSYEELTAYYRSHYSPSNCFIFLYGHIDTEEVLSYISDEYLDRFEVGEVYRVNEIADDCFDSDVRAPYPADESKLEKGYYFSYNFAVHIPHTALSYLVLNVLDRILCTSNGAYIQDAMQKAGIGEDFYAIADNMVKCPWFGFISAGCRESDREKFIEVIDNTLAALVKNGIDKDRLNATLNMLEFYEKEDGRARRIKGVSYAIHMIPKLIYGEEDPIELIEIFDAIDRLKELAETDFFEKFIEEHFVRNAHKSVVTLYPDTHFTEREDGIISEKCSRNAADKDFNELVNDYRSLNAYRNSQDTPEQEALIPILERSDLSDDPDYRPSEHISIQGGELVWQDRPTNSIAYLEWRFDLRKLDESLLPYYRIFTELFGAVDTKSHSYTELSNLIDTYTGGLSHELLVWQSLTDGTVTPVMSWMTRFLYDKADQAFEINREILTETDFSDSNHIRDMLLQLKMGLERDMLEKSHTTAFNIGLSAFSKVYAWKDRLEGYSFYRFLCNLLESYDSRKDELKAAMERIRCTLLDSTNWQFAYIGEGSFLETAKRMTEDFIVLLDEDKLVKPERINDVALSEKQNIAYCAPSQVQYDALCGKLPKEAVKKHGHFLVLAHLLNTDYLWQKVRVLGGAYGVSVKFFRNGDAGMVSFRDPNLDDTFKCFREVIGYIQSLEMEERTFRQFVIGAINTLDRPQPEYQKGMVQIYRELTGLTAEEEARTRKQIISATLDDIKALVPYLESWINGATKTVIGNEQKIAESSVRFDSTKSLL